MPTPSKEMKSAKLTWIYSQGLYLISIPKLFKYWTPHFRFHPLNRSVLPWSSSNGAERCKEDKLREDDPLSHGNAVKDPFPNDDDEDGSSCALPRKGKGRGRGRIINDQESEHVAGVGDDDFIKHQIGRYLGSDHRGSYEQVGSQHSPLAEQKEVFNTMRGVKQDPRPMVFVNGARGGRRCARLGAIFWVSRESERSWNITVITNSIYDRLIIFVTNNF